MSGPHCLTNFRFWSNSKSCEAVAPLAGPAFPLRVNTNRLPRAFLATPTASPIVWPGTTRFSTSSVMLSRGDAFSSAACLASAACCSGFCAPPPWPETTTPSRTTANNAMSFFMTNLPCDGAVPLGTSPGERRGVYTLRTAGSGPGSAHETSSSVGVRSWRIVPAQGAPFLRIGYSPACYFGQPLAISYAIVAARLQNASPETHSSLCAGIPHAGIREEAPWFAASRRAR